MDWGSMGPGEEWVNTTKREGETGKTLLSQITNGIKINPCSQRAGNEDEDDDDAHKSHHRSRFSVDLTASSQESECVLGFFFNKLLIKDCVYKKQDCERFS